MRKKILTTIVIALGVVISSTGASGSGCSDPGKPGEAKHVTIYIKPGVTKLTKAHYGFWHAVDPSPNCRWVIQTPKGGVEQSGGWKDHPIIGTSMRGHTIVVSTSCNEFAK